MLFNPKVCTAFYNDYLLDRSKDWNSVCGQVEATFVCDYKSQKYEACVEINKKLHAENAQTISGLIPILYYLGNVGRENSHLCSANQMTRTYILSEISKNTDAEGLLRTEREKLRKKVDKLETKVGELDRMVSLLMSKKNTTNEISAYEETVFTAKKRKYHETLLKLADLNEELAISQATRLGLFNGLEFPNKITEYNKPLGKTSLYDTLYDLNPYYYHSNFFLIHYERVYRDLPHVKKDFEEYLQTAFAGSPTIKKPEEYEGIYLKISNSASNFLSSLKSQSTTSYALSVSGGLKK